jgi:hypothetical protein
VDLAAAIIDGHDGWLRKYDAAAADVDERIGCAEVDGDVGCAKARDGIEETDDRLLSV